MADINIEIQGDEVTQTIVVQQDAPPVNIELSTELSEVNIEVLPLNAGDKNYLHTQTLPSTQWNVAHNLNKYPSVTIVNSAGDEVIGGVKFIDLNNVQLKFSAAFSGEAYFN